jgi:hypothetical protein
MRESISREYYVMPRPRKPSDAVRFQTGAKVRVKSGIRVPDFSDIPLGGWSGTITEVDAKPPVTFLIKWDRRTLELMHPVYRKRCERDGFEMETMWLGEEDIEPDDGTPVPIEQPTQIKTPPLSEKDQDDRVRMALGLTHDDPLPDVSRKTILAYYRYLAANLKFPFKAKTESDGTTLTVSRLIDPKQSELEEEEGLLCEARDRQASFTVPLSELEDAVGNRKLVEDYGYWFWNWH